MEFSFRDACPPQSARWICGTCRKDLTEPRCECSHEWHGPPCTQKMRRDGEGKSSAPPLRQPQTARGAGNPHTGKTGSSVWCLPTRPFFCPASQKIWAVGAATILAGTGSGHSITWREGVQLDPLGAVLQAGATPCELQKTCHQVEIPPGPPDGTFLPRSDLNHFYPHRSRVHGYQEGPAMSLCLDNDFFHFYLKHMYVYLYHLLRVFSLLTIRWGNF